MRFARASPPLRHRDGVAVLGRWKAANTANPIMLAVLRSWQCPHTSTISSRGGSPGNADWEGRKADSIGIRPVHLEWTIVDGGSFPPSHGAYSAIIETRQARRLLRAKAPMGLGPASPGLLSASSPGRAKFASRPTASGQPFEAMGISAHQPCCAAGAVLSFSARLAPGGALSSVATG